MKKDGVRSSTTPEGVLEVSGVGCRTLEELIELGEVDLTAWEVDRHVVNKWDVQLRGGKMGVCWQVKAWFRPIASGLGKEAILEALRGESEVVAKPRARSWGKAPAGGPDIMLEPCLFDAHIGMRADSMETGWPDWSLEKGGEVFLWAVEELIRRAKPYPISKVLLPIGNDFLHVDSRAGMTTRGTPQDADLYPRIFRSGVRLLYEAISRLAEVAPVEVIAIPGNHDEHGTFHLAEAVWAYFHRDRRVTVDATWVKRKYRRHGRVMLGFVHGHDTPTTKLPGLMAVEADPEELAKVTWREWHTGHTHRSGLETRTGVRIRQIPSLVSPDKFHARTGLIHLWQCAEAYLWEASTGYAGTLSANIDPRTAEPMPLTGAA